MEHPVNLFKLYLQFWYLPHLLKPTYKRWFRLTVAKLWVPTEFLCRRIAERGKRGRGHRVQRQGKGYRRCVELLRWTVITLVSEVEEDKDAAMLDSKRLNMSLLRWISCACSSSRSPSWWGLHTPPLPSCSWRGGCTIRASCAITSLCISCYSHSVHATDLSFSISRSVRQI